MALQTKTISYGSFDYKSYSNAYVLDLILTEESTDPVANTSQLSFKLQLRSGGSNRFAAYIDCAATVAGETFQVKDYHVTAAYHYTYTLLTGSVTVPHREDGTMEIQASASIDTPESNPYAPPDLSFAGTMVLTDIPRASTLAATAAAIESAATVVVSRKSDRYTHTVQYRFGALSGYLADGVGSLSDTPVQLTETTLLFPIPQTFYGEIPDSPSGQCLLSCTTWLGDTQIGDAQTAVFTVTADPALCGPVITGTAADTNEATLALTGDASAFVQGESNVLCSFQPQARKGASVREIFVNGVPVEGSSLEISKITTAAITYRVTDSRGYSCECAVPGLTLVPYAAPGFHAGVSRTDPTSGNGTLTVQGKWYPGSFGAVSNALSAQYGVDGGSWVTFTPTTDGEDFRASEALEGLDYQQGHRVEIQLSDRLHTVTKTATVSKGIPVFDWGENDFAFHVPVRFTATDGTVFTLDLADGALTIIT